jgi:uncharacterized protein YlaI
MVECAKMPYKNKKDRPTKGLCTQCPNPVKPYYTRCEKCLEVDSRTAKIRQHKLRNKRIKKGLCYKCGVPLHEDADKGKLSCINCRESGGWNYYLRP